MDIDNNEPQTTTVSHRRVLDTLSAVCTQDSVVRDVIPRLMEHTQHLCEGRSHKSYVLGSRGVVN